MITRTVWIIWTPMSAVPKKVIKFNHSLTHPMGKWPWRCASTGLDELDLEGIDPVVAEFWRPRNSKGFYHAHGHGGAKERSDERANGRRAFFSIRTIFQDITSYTITVRCPNTNKTQVCIDELGPLAPVSAALYRHIWICNLKSTIILRQ